MSRHSAKPMRTKHRSREGRRVGPRRRQIGFTLIELLTILIILGLLISLAGPSILRARTIFRVRECQARIRLIDGACGMYYADWDSQYPPSTSATIGGKAMQGRHRLVQSLIAYMPASADGYDGFGARKVDRGKVYGPYVGLENMERSVNQPFAFMDTFGNEIYYYRGLPVGGGSVFEAGDNKDGPPTLGKYLQDANGNYFRKDYVILSPGPNTKWDPNADTGDDIGNYTRRR